MEVPLEHGSKPVREEAEEEGKSSNMQGFVARFKSLDFILE